MENAYTAIQVLEEIDRYLTDDKHRSDFHMLLEELHKIVDDKVTEFFYPRKGS